VAGELFVVSGTPVLAALQVAGPDDGSLGWNAEVLPHGPHFPEPRFLIEEVQFVQEAPGVAGNRFDDRIVAVGSEALPLGLVHILQALLHRGFGGLGDVGHVVDHCEGVVLQLQRISAGDYDNSCTSAHI